MRKSLTFLGFVGYYFVFYDLIFNETYAVFNNKKHTAIINLKNRAKKDEHNIFFE